MWRIEMRALGLGLLLISMGIVGCGPDIRTECEERVQCRGGNDLDIEACVDASDVVYDFVVDLECDDEYDAYFACIQPLTNCRTMPTGQTCMASTDCSDDDTCTDGQCVTASYSVAPEDRDKCDKEFAAYSSCFNFN